eukprot:GEMP01016499.1.p1 GENE.GEMP01016499.1~~GEMP01016499.1.p1  ORF type:complete len:376 (+),score=77.73 GEMP01016499.1:159-1286(+)
MKRKGLKQYCLSVGSRKWEISESKTRALLIGNHRCHFECGTCGRRTTRELMLLTPCDVCETQQIDGWRCSPCGWRVCGPCMMAGPTQTQGSDADGEQATCALSDMLLDVLLVEAEGSLAKTKAAIAGPCRGLALTQARNQKTFVEVTEKTGVNKFFQKPRNTNITDFSSESTPRKPLDIPQLWRKNRVPSKLSRIAPDKQDRAITNYILEQVKKPVPSATQELDSLQQSTVQATAATNSASSSAPPGRFYRSTITSPPCDDDYRSGKCNTLPCTRPEADKCVEDDFAVVLCARTHRDPYSPYIGSSRRFKTWAHRIARRPILGPRCRAFSTNRNKNSDVQMKWMPAQNKRKCWSESLCKPRQTYSGVTGAGMVAS